MIGTILGGAAGIIAAPVVGGLAWRKARQRRVAKALEITTSNRIVEEPKIRQRVVPDDRRGLPGGNRLCRSRNDPPTRSHHHTGW